MKLLQTVCPDDFNTVPLRERYRRIRIPGLVATENGGLLLYYECRSGGDWSAIDVGLQRSDDGGNTWSETGILVSGKGRNAVNNPVMIADGNTVHFLYCENYKRLFYQKSADGGATWTAPRELTDGIDAEAPDLGWTVLATGPGHGIKLSSGRLLVPVWFAVNPDDMFSHHPSLVSVLYSDDGGGNWRLGGFLGEDMAEDYSECAAAEDADGTLILNIRNESPRKLRKTAASRDGGVTWSEPAFEPALPDPTCCAGLCRAGDSLLFSNCESRTERRRLTVKRIKNGNIVAKTEISPEAGYSDIAFDPHAGRAFVAFENESAVIRIAVLSLNEENQ